MNQQEKSGPKRLLNLMLAGGLLIFAALSASAGITDLADSPNARNAFLDAGWERELVNGRWWMFFLVAILGYAIRLRLAFRITQDRRAFRWIVPVEIFAIAILSVLFAAGLSWNSVVR